MKGGHTKPSQEDGDDLSLLFRPKAVGYAARRIQGEVILGVSPPLWAFSAALVACILGLLIVGATARIGKQEIVQGWLAPEAGLMRFEAQQAGTIDLINVVEGQRVARNQLLVRIRRRDSAAGGELASIFDRTKQAEAMAADAQFSDDQSAAEERAADLADQGASLAIQLREVETQLRVQQSRLELARSALSRVESISDQGYLPARELDARRSAVLEAEQSSSSARLAILAVRRQISETRALVSQNRIARARLQSQRVGQLATAERSASEGEAAFTSLVTAPIPGTVTALMVHTGQEVASGTPLMQLIPRDDHLTAVLLVPTSGVAFLKPGQQVRVRYDAFPYRQFGTFPGVIKSISGTPLLPSELTREPVSTNRPHFRVIVLLDDQAVTANGTRIPLRAGALLSASIETDRRTLMQWIFDPLRLRMRR